MSNTNLTIDKITRESLRVLHQKLNFIGSVNRQYDNQFAQSGGKIGSVLRVRLPRQFTVRSGRTIDVQDSVEKKVDLTLATQKGVDVEFTSAELTMELDQFSEMIIDPAMSVLAANIESDMLASVYKNVYNQVDNSGASMTFANVLDARRILANNLAPPDSRMVCMDTQANADMVDALKGLFNDPTSISKQYRDGFVGRTAGFDFVENTLLPIHTPGAEDGSYVTNAATAQTGSSLIVDTGTGTIKAGDVFTIADVYNVHPETKVSTGELKTFVVTADSAGGGVTLSISPEIIATGAYQNVSNAAADGKALTFQGTASTAHNISMAYHKNAFAFVTADLIMPDGVDWAARKVFDGISMRIVRQYDINNDNFPCRIDVLHGFGTLRPELSCRLAAN